MKDFKSADGSSRFFADGAAETYLRCIARWVGTIGGLTFGKNELKNTLLKKQLECIETAVRLVIKHRGNTKTQAPDFVDGFQRLQKFLEESVDVDGGKHAIRLHFPKYIWDLYVAMWCRRPDCHVQ